MNNGISIIVPVGPDEAYRQYLEECLTSILAQMQAGDEILVVDDMAHLRPEELSHYVVPDGAFLHYVKMDWLVGCSTAWNIGVALARNEWCILMGSDDKLLPNCLDQCRTAQSQDPLGYFNISCQIDTGEQVSAFNNAAMVSKALWRETGGFPLTGSVGAPDALLVSIMMVHMPHHLHQVNQSTPLYWCRTGPYQDTKKYAAPFSYEVLRIRDFETARWTSPRWSKA